MSLKTTSNPTQFGTAGGGVEIEKRLKQKKRKKLKIPKRGKN